MKWHTISIITFLFSIKIMLLTKQVVGLEVNPTWWESEHATPHYIPLEYLQPPPPPKNENSLDDWRTPEEVTNQYFLTIILFI